jgi:hypothetical protein
MRRWLSLTGSPAFQAVRIRLAVCSVVAETPIKSVGYDDADELKNNGGNFRFRLGLSPNF